MISAASAVRYVAQWRRDRTGAPKPQGGDRRLKLAPFRDVIIALVDAQPDITMPALAEIMADQHTLQVDPSSLSKFLCRQGYTYKKNAFGIGERARER